MVEDVWWRAVYRLGGNQEVAQAAEGDLLRRYAEPHRRYHDLAHVRAVRRDASVLAEKLGLSETERALLTVATGAHDVVYECRPGQDERRSADWARDWLLRAGVGEAAVIRVEGLVLATLEHAAPPGDLTAQALLDADLAVLGADPATYARYRAAVRAEYAGYDGPTWRAGRAAVLEGLLRRVPLYGTEPARERWEAAARANVGGELAALRGPVTPICDADL